MSFRNILHLPNDLTLQIITLPSLHINNTFDKNSSIHTFPILIHPPLPFLNFINLHWTGIMFKYYWSIIEAYLKHYWNILEAYLKHNHQTSPNLPQHYPNSQHISYHHPTSHSLSHLPLSFPSWNHVELFLKHTWILLEANLTQNWCILEAYLKHTWTLEVAVGGMSLRLTDFAPSCLWLCFSFTSNQQLRPCSAVVTIVAIYLPMPLYSFL